MAKLRTHSVVRIAAGALLVLFVALGFALKKCPKCGKTYEDVENYCAECTGADGKPVKLKTVGAAKPEPAPVEPAVKKWTRTIGGARYDVGYGVELAPDGGYVVAGQTGSYAIAGPDTNDWQRRDMWLVKLNSDGQVEWQRTFGGGFCDYARAVVANKDGGYTLAGATLVREGELYKEEGFVVRTDLDGNGIWEKSVAAGFHSFIHAAVAKGDGSFVLSGGSSAWLLMMDADGNVTKDSTYGSDRWWYCSRDVVAVGEDGYLLVGHVYRAVPGTDLAGPRDVCLWRIDSAGCMRWQKRYGGLLDDYGRAACRTSDGGFAVVGRTQSFGDPLGNAWLLRLTADGTVLWSKNYGGPAGDHGRDVVQTSDGGFAITGFTSSSGAGKRDVWLVKTDKDGKQLWARTYGGPLVDEGYALRQTKDGGFIIIGITGSFGEGAGDAWVIKTDANGNAQ